VKPLHTGLTVNKILGSVTVAAETFCTCDIIDIVLDVIAAQPIPLLVMGKHIATQIVEVIVRCTGSIKIPYPFMRL
jgi:hypothetical protein